MKDFFLIDGAKRMSSHDLVKMYGSEEKVLLCMYDWDKSKTIVPNADGDYVRNS